MTQVSKEEKKIVIDEKDNSCNSKVATHIVSWAGKLHKCCIEHAKQLQILGRVIGSPTDVQTIITDEPCYQMKKEN